VCQREGLAVSQRCHLAIWGKDEGKNEKGKEKEEEEIKEKKGGKIEWRFSPLKRKKKITRNEVYQDYVLQKFFQCGPIQYLTRCGCAIHGPYYTGNTGYSSGCRREGNGF
jgi:hypothetical protein